jgi:hypothetical protein
MRRGSCGRREGLTHLGRNHVEHSILLLCVKVRVDKGELPLGVDARVEPWIMCVLENDTRATCPPRFCVSVG